MNYSVSLHGKRMEIALSRRAEKALRRREQPVTAVVHLIFGCMVAKRVWFRDQVDVAVTPVTDKLNLNFDVVRYAVCSLKNIDGGATPEPFPLGKEIRSFVPDSLVIDYHKRRFTGEFTYRRMPVMATAAPGQFSTGGAVSAI
jgi:hypothetical protein